MPYRIRPGLFEFDVGRLDHLGSCLDFRPLEGCNLIGRQGGGLHAQRLQAILHLGRLQDFGDFAVQLINDGFGGAGRHKNALPRDHLKAGHTRLGHGGRIGQ